MRKSRRRTSNLKCDNSINMIGNAKINESRREPIRQPFLFEGQVIYPCYCFLPLVTDEEAKKRCNIEYLKKKRMTRRRKKLDIKIGQDPISRRTYAKEEVSANDFITGPIKEPVSFKGEVIYPCYCILPYITDAELKTRCRRSITGIPGTGHKKRKRDLYACKFCDYTYSRTSSLSIHMKTTHQRVYDFECDVCECHKLKRKCEISRSGKDTKRRRTSVVPKMTEGSETSLSEGGCVPEDEVEKEEKRGEKCQLCNFVAEVQGGLLNHLMTHHVADCLGFSWQFKKCIERNSAPIAARKLRLSIHVVDEIAP